MHSSSTYRVVKYYKGRRTVLDEGLPLWKARFKVWRRNQFLRDRPYAWEREHPPVSYGEYL